MPTRNTTTFLLVEDSLDDAFLVEIEFKKTPHLQLRVVRDGQEAIEYLQGLQPYNDRTKFAIPNVILLDLKMPRIGGFEFLQWLHTEAPEDIKLIPVIVMSGSNLEQDIKRAYELGANIYMSKPVDWNQFRERMKLLGILWSEHAETPGLAHS